MQRIPYALKDTIMSRELYRDSMKPALTTVHTAFLLYEQRYFFRCRSRMAIR